MMSIATHHTTFRNFILLLCSLWLAGCATSTRLDKIVRTDTASPVGYVEIDRDYAGAVAVYRGGLPQRLVLPMTLQAGDEIETGHESGAVIRYADGGEVVLAPGTRVRLGSLEVLFGRIFASMRGLFSAEDESVLASVEGTRFMLDAQEAGRTRVVVLDGTVRCSAKTGRWVPQRLQPGQALQVDYRFGEVPRIEPARRGELEEIERWSHGIRTAPRLGYCCAGGDVFPTISTRCRGRFESSEERAHHQCMRGWCCAGGGVESTVRANCRGSFHLDHAAAARACTAPQPQPRPEPQPQPGWCCINGKVGRTDAATCRARSGGFYTNQRSAEAACERPVHQMRDEYKPLRLPPLQLPQPNPNPSQTPVIK